MAIDPTTFDQALMSAIGGSPVALVLFWAIREFLSRQERDVARLEAAQKDSTEATHAVTAEVIGARRDIADLPDKLAARIKQ